MRNPPPDKYNVAWFKLAECVSRGEKERALGVYRLLAHSLNDAAFARQLQGDILLSFADTLGAIEHYQQASRLYEQDGRLLESAALYEHMAHLVTDKQNCLLKLVDLYFQLAMGSRLMLHAHALMTILLNTGQYAQALDMLDRLAQTQEETMGELSRLVIGALARASHTLTPGLQQHIQRTITVLSLQGDTIALQQFMTMLEVVNGSYYAYALSCI
jgi:tetratricopeptide (TPR) repeat protein